MSKAWLVLFAAGCLEVIWAIGLKYNPNFNRVIPNVVILAAMLGSILLLTIALKELPVGTAYAVWTGIGIIGTTLLGILYFNESIHSLRLLCIVLILIGCIGLKWTSNS